eukprot:3940538-Rhodomonas_salina.3
MYPRTCLDSTRRVRLSRLNSASGRPRKALLSPKTSFEIRSVPVWTCVRARPCPCSSMSATTMRMRILIPARGGERCGENNEALPWTSLVRSKTWPSSAHLIIDQKHTLSVSDLVLSQLDGRDAMRLTHSEQDSSWDEDALDARREADHFLFRCELKGFPRSPRTTTPSFSTSHISSS